MTFEEFSTLAQSYNVVPVSRSLLADTLTPVSAYLRLREGAAGSFLFESVEGGEHIARYSFIGRDPIVQLRCRDNATAISDQHGERISKDNFFDIIDGVIRKYRQAPLPHLPRFNGGLVGFIGYDAVRFIEQIPSRSTEKYGYPDSVLGLFTQLIAFDHVKHQLILIHNAIIDGTTSLDGQFRKACEELDRLERLILSVQPPSAGFHITEQDAKPEISPDEYCSIVRKAKQYITDGDIFQVVLSQRFVTSYSGDVFNVYRALRVVNPSPYLYFLDFGKEKIIGSSPEILVRVENGLAEVYPIAGTRPRGKTDEEDRVLESELLNDEKERAEHIMLVDLGRNDLGRVCTMGSVTVDQLMFVVRYSHVMHIATRVTGKVGDGKTCTDVLKATFPAGTVSGAPKIRAMEIIDELERYRRGFYAGGVGYFDFSGNMDLCIAIRTMFVSEDRIFLQSGAGIVADSIPEKEYQETVNKARALVDALHMAEGIIH